MEAATAASQPTPQHGPMAMLRDEREVQALPGKMAWLFEPYLQDLYERRQWQEIERFETFSPGARLVGGAGAGDGAHRRAGQRQRERAQLDKFHADRRKWLVVVPARAAPATPTAAASWST